jgi:hypothetical protein
MIEPYKTMNEWYKNNKASIDTNLLTEQVQVASWAIVVNITTKENTLFKTGELPILKGWGYMFPPSI